MKISVVVNTYNEENNLGRCLESVKGFADEIVVVDMHSGDKTVGIAQKHGAKIFQYEYTRYVEPARNFALRQAQGSWILLIDADEELPESLAGKLKEIVEGNEVDYVEIPRKNIIFGKWIEHSRWWPDFLVRFFRKGKVKFSDKIHVPPTADGRKMTLEPKIENALIHYNFQSIFQFVERLNRYTDIQTVEAEQADYKFDWKDLLIKPSNEFFSRFFAGEGYKDGLHGLALGLLQSFSEFILYLKLWEKQGFKDQEISDFGRTTKKISQDFFYWHQKQSSGILTKMLLILTKMLHKIRAKIR